MALRRDLAKELMLAPGRDLGFNETTSNISLLLAYERYRGIVYRRSRFAELYPKRRAPSEVIIISALYGVLTAADPIRNYELHMKDTLSTGTRVLTWWRRNGLGSILESVIRSLEPSKVVDLLSGSYREAVKPWPPEGLKNLVTSFNFPGVGSGSSYRRGDLLRIWIGQKELDM